MNAQTLAIIGLALSTLSSAISTALLIRRVIDGRTLQRLENRLLHRPDDPEWDRVITVDQIDRIWLKP